MARKRMEEPDIKSWEEADGALRMIRNAELRIAQINADMEKCVMDIKEIAAREAQPLQDQIKKLGLQLKEFVTANKAELNGKSRQLTFGQVGFRFSTKVVLPKELSTVIKQLRKLGMTDCINVKESVNKDILKTYDEKTVVEVGGSLKKEDTFWYETSREELPEET